MDINKIIEKLKKGEIKMHPKWHFILKAVLFGLAVFIIGLFCLFLCSFILFSFRPFPWFLFLLLILFVALLEHLFNKYSFAYKRPVIYSLIIIVSLLFVMGLMMNKVCFHEMMEKRNLPGIEKFYKKYPCKECLKEKIRNLENPNFEIKKRREL